MDLKEIQRRFTEFETLGSRGKFLLFNRTYQSYTWSDCMPVTDLRNWTVAAHNTAGTIHWFKSAEQIFLFLTTPTGGGLQTKSYHMATNDSFDWGKDYNINESERAVARAEARNGRDPKEGK